MKSVESFGLPSLNYNPDPSRQRGEYITFIEKLKLVLSTVKQTKKVLSSVSDVKEPKTQSANVALFRVICAQVDGYLRHQLQEIQVSTGREDKDALHCCCFGICLQMRRIWNIKSTH